MKVFKFSNGDEMPGFGLNTCGIDPDKTYDAVRKAIQLGYRYFDSAPYAGNLSEVGRALAGAMADGEVNRESLWISSKLENDNHRYMDVEPACEAALEALQLDYLDMYLIHWPVSHERGIIIPETEDDFLAESEAPLDDTWVGMEDCLDAGLTKHLGVCNFNIANLKFLQEDANEPPELNQCEFHPYLPQPTLYDFCRSEKILMTAYAPLGSPNRPMSQQNQDEPFLLNDPVILDIAAKHACTPVQALIAYGITRKMAVLAGSADEGHLAENLAASELKLDREDLRTLITLPKYRFLKGEQFTLSGSPYKLSDIWEY